MYKGFVGTCKNSSVALQLLSHLASQGVMVTWQQNSYHHTTHDYIKTILSPYFTNLPIYTMVLSYSCHNIDFAPLQHLTYVDGTMQSMESVIQFYFG